MSAWSLEIHGLAGTYCTVEVDKSALGRAVKKQICASIGVPPAEQKLFADARELTNGMPLHDVLQSPAKGLSLLIRPPDHSLWIKLVAMDRLSLEYLPPEASDVPDVVHTAIWAHGPQQLRLAGEFARRSRKVVLAAVAQDGRSLEFASPELRADREVVLRAVKHDRRSLEFASPELRSDREVVSLAFASLPPGFRI